MFRLLSHVEGSSESPFLCALNEIAAGGRLKLTGPYLSTKLLDSLMQSAKALLIIADVEEWLRSLSAQQRALAVEFIRQNQSNIRHCRNLHAKVAIGASSAMFGSANFTDMGLFNREEMGAFLDDPQDLDALNEWFDRLWERCSPINLDEVDAFSIACAVLDAPRPTIPAAARLTSPPTHNAKRPYAKPQNISASARDDDERRLIKRLSLAPDRAWIEGFFALARLLIETLDLDCDSPSLATTLPQRNNLPLSLNNRWALVAEFRANWLSARPDEGIIQRAPSQCAVMAMCNPVDLAELPCWTSKAWRVESFGRQSGEAAASVPHLVYLESPLALLNDVELQRSWLDATQRELPRMRRSMFKKYHHPLFFRAIADERYLSELLDEAFGG